MNAIYPGSFDPLTNGHINIIKRASKNFDKVYVALAINIKKEYLFDYKQRMMMIAECIKNFDNVEVVATNKLVVEYAKEHDISVIIRGLRAVSDFEHELQFATNNYFLDENIETVFYMSRPQHMFLSSSQVREIAKFGGDISEFVPSIVEKYLTKIYE
ncbi:MAG: pantetheine-phosphate adenylyltransferase [Bacilli bacterium]